MFKIAVIGFSLLIMGCAVKISDVAVKPTPQYKFSQEKEGLKIAIDPFFEEERLKEYFGTDLISHGILPLLIIAENHHPKAGYLLEKSFFSATMGIGKEQETKEDAELSTYQTTKEATAIGITTGTLVAIVPISAIAAIPLSLYASKIVGDIEKINDNLSKKAFVDRTVFPGESHSGFIYFQLKNREELQNISTIMLKAKDMSSEKELDFIFLINK